MEADQDTLASVAIHVRRLSQTEKGKAGWKLAQTGFADGVHEIPLQVTQSGFQIGHQFSLV